MQRICKMKSKNDNIDKKILQQEKRYSTKLRDCLQSSSIKHLPLTTVKRMQWKIDDTVERSTDNFPVEENEKLLLNKNIVKFQ